MANAFEVKLGLGLELLSISGSESELEEFAGYNEPPEILRYVIVPFTFTLVVFLTKPFLY